MESTPKCAQCEYIKKVDPSAGLLETSSPPLLPFSYPLAHTSKPFCCRNRPDATTAKAILPSDLTDWACAIHLTAARGGAANLALRGTSETAIHYLIGTAVTAGTGIGLCCFEVVVVLLPATGQKLLVGIKFGRGFRSAVMLLLASLSDHLRHTVDKVFSSA